MLTLAGGVVQAHIDYTSVVLAVRASAVLVKAEIYRRIASGIDARTVYTLASSDLAKVI
jgi:hypothetical protein